MGMKFTQIPANNYKELQLNAGVLLSDFNPATAELDLSEILGATDGGVNVTATPQEPCISPFLRRALDF